MQQFDRVKQTTISKRRVFKKMSPSPVVLLLGCKTAQVRSLFMKNNIFRVLYPSCPPILLSLNKDALGWGARQAVNLDVYAVMFESVLNGAAVKAGLGDDWRAQVRLIVFGTEFEHSRYPEQDKLAPLLELLDMKDFGFATVFLESTSEPYLSPKNSSESVPPPSHERPIEELELGVRAYNCLKSVGINTLEQLTAKTPDELLAIPNFGKRSLEDVRAALKEVTRFLKTDLTDQLPPGMAHFPIGELNLGIRAYNCLKRFGIETIGHLVARSEEDLKKIPNLGKHPIEEIKESLAEHGLKLKD